MKRVTVGIFVLVAMMFAMTGCKGDPVKDDIMGYSKSGIPTFNKFTAEITKKMNDLQNAPKKDEFINKEVVPQFKDFKEKMGAIKPATKELQEIHDTYVTALTSGEEAIKMLAKAVEKQDQKLFKTAGDKIDALSLAEDKYKKDFNELAKKHGVKIE
jgi:DNA repair ATPase RecN